MKALKALRIIGSDFLESRVAGELRTFLGFVLLGIAVGAVVVAILIGATDIMAEGLRFIDMFWPIGNLLPLLLFGWLTMAGAIAGGFLVYVVFVVLFYLITAIIEFPGKITAYYKEVKERINDETDL